jgi:hypothetical protein
MENMESPEEAGDYIRVDELDEDEDEDEDEKASRSFFD